MGDRDEAELRNKLVSNLKEKEIKKMKECGDKIRNDKLYSDGEESREEISDDEEDDTSRSPRDRDDRREEMSVVIASPSQKKEKSRNFILLKGKGTWIKYQRKIFA